MTAKPHKRPPRRTKSYTLHLPESGKISPVIFDNPHSGRTLPDHFRYNCAKDKLMDFGDLHIDKLLSDLPNCGIPVLEAHIHRACIDLNRHADEINPARIKGKWTRPHTLSYYTKDKLGVIPERLGRPHDKPLTLIFNEKTRPTAAEVEHRIHAYHEPYYRALNALMGRSVIAHGFAAHIDVHSFHRRPHEDSPDIIIGDLNGNASHPKLVALVADHFEKMGYRIDFNGIFSGAAIIQTTGAPAKGRHAIQIEVARDLYLDKSHRKYDTKRAVKLRNALTSLGALLYDYLQKPDYAADLLPEGAPPTPETPASSSNTSSQQARNAASSGIKPSA